MAAPFLETPRFPEDISFDSSGGPEYSTTVTQVKSGAENRIQNWVYPLHQYDVAKNNRSAAVIETLLSFFHGVGGRYYGFRYKDWLDFKSCSYSSVPASTNQLLGTGNAVATQFQLIKTYTVGAISRVRKIYKPVSGTVTVSINNVLQSSGWTVDATTGIITFSTPPGNGLAVKAGYEFDVPVRFDSDLLNLSMDDFEAFTTSVVLREIRDPL